LLKKKKRKKEEVYVIDSFGGRVRLQQSKEIFFMDGMNGVLCGKKI
jgi:hypothetical protein